MLEFGLYTANSGSKSAYALEFARDMSFPPQIPNPVLHLGEELIFGGDFLQVRNSVIKNSKLRKSNNK